MNYYWTISNITNKVSLYMYNEFIKEYTKEELEEEYKDIIKCYFFDKADQQRTIQQYKDGLALFGDQK